MVTKSLRERFEEKYFKEPNSGCWLWTGCVSGRGYGSIGSGGRGGKMLSAHRTSWELYRGAIPDGMIICHKCDTPSCVNPDHLFLGSSTDNNRDTVQKGRHKYGLGGARITTEEVRQIRAVDAAHEFLADLYSIGTNQIGRIKNGTRWAFVD